ncbi:hypothetical protein SO694_00053250 [Aureococcus anophagefferens]|uniref:Uncharacterized protein n=1 Tax=Aureococcus anophagefferens TaxID=44056 RepID=A0ABR1FY11_AURAN
MSSLSCTQKAIIATLALAGVVDAAECRGPSSCGCSNNEFCNFDDGSSGGCESCSSFSSAAACGQDGLPSDGEDDCAACCFGSDASDDGASSGGAGECLGPSACGRQPPDLPREIHPRFYLEDVAGSLYGADKGAVADAMADNEAKLDMPNGAHEEYGAGTSLEGQELYWAETPVEGDGSSAATTSTATRPSRRSSTSSTTTASASTRRATRTARCRSTRRSSARRRTTRAPTSLGGTGLWGEGQDDWIEELADEGSLTQEYLASVVDVYYGLWAHYGAGMWGVYEPAGAGAGDLETVDPNAWAMVPQFFADHLTWLAYLPDTFEGTFTLAFDDALCYTHKSQRSCDEDEARVLVREEGDARLRVGGEEEDEERCKKKNAEKVKAKDAPRRVLRHVMCLGACCDAVMDPHDTDFLNQTRACDRDL